MYILQNICVELATIMYMYLQVILDINTILNVSKACSGKSVKQTFHEGIELYKSFCFCSIEIQLCDYYWYLHIMLVPLNTYCACPITLNNANYG